MIHFSSASFLFLILYLACCSISYMKSLENRFVKPSNLFVSCNTDNLECRRTVAGHEYVGSKSFTTSGKECQEWTEQIPHKHRFTGGGFSDGTAAAAGNKCRNPDIQYKNTVWCHTKDPTVAFEDCDVPICGKKCIYLLNVSCRIDVL